MKHLFSALAFFAFPSVAGATPLSITAGNHAIDVYVASTHYATIPARSTLSFVGFENGGNYEVKLVNKSNGKRAKRMVRVQYGTKINAKRWFRHKLRTTDVYRNQRTSGVRTQKRNRQRHHRTGYVQHPGCVNVNKIQRLWLEDGRDSSQFDEMIATLCSDKFNSGDTAYYRNGTRATSWFGRKNASWYYPNGRLATSWAGANNANWYYPNGKIATNGINTRHSSWYYPNGQPMK